MAIYIGFYIGKDTRAELVAMLDKIPKSEKAVDVYIATTEDHNKFGSISFEKRLTIGGVRFIVPNSECEVSWEWLESLDDGNDTLMCLGKGFLINLKIPDTGTTNLYVIDLKNRSLTKVA